MVKGLSSDQITAVAKSEVKIRILLTIYLKNAAKDVLRILENDTLAVLTIEGAEYIAGSVKRGDIQTSLDGSVEKTNIVISNINRDISSIIINDGDVLTNSKCTIDEIIFDTATNTIIDDPVELFSGVINNIALSCIEFTFDVERAMGGYSAQSPNTTYDVSCQWVFKDCRCQYNGGLPSCDKTLTSCNQRANAPRFGGYPSIPVEMTRKK